jgi:hypothetical protein
LKKNISAEVDLGSGLLPLYVFISAVLSYVFPECPGDQLAKAYCFFAISVTGEL